MGLGAMEKKMVIGYIGTTTRIHSFIPRKQKVRKDPNPEP